MPLERERNMGYKFLIESIMTQNEAGENCSLGKQRVFRPLEMKTAAGQASKELWDCRLLP